LFETWAILHVVQILRDLSVHSTYTITRQQLNIDSCHRLHLQLDNEILI